MNQFTPPSLQHPEVTWHAAQWRIRPSCLEQVEIHHCWRKHCGQTPPCYSEPAECGQGDSIACETDRQTDRWEINSTYQQPSGGGVSDRPDGAVVAPGDGDRLFGVEVECPQFALTVTLHQQNRFVPVSDHDLEDLAVLRSRQDPVGLPADAADGQTWNRKHSWLFMKQKLYATPSACLTEHMMCWSSSTAAANVLLDRFDTSVKWLDPF